MVVVAAVLVAAVLVARLVCDSIVAVAAVGIAVGHIFVAVAVEDIAVDVSDRAVLLHRRLLDPYRTPNYHLAFPMEMDRRTRLFGQELFQFQRSFGCGHCGHV